MNSLLRNNSMQILKTDAASIHPGPLTLRVFQLQHVFKRVCVLMAQDKQLDSISN